MAVSPRRIHHLNDILASHGPVVYWMSRNQLVADNWALLHVQQLALERQVPLAVLFTLADSLLGATRTAMPASSGASAACITGPGANDRCSARSAT